MAGNVFERDCENKDLYNELSILAEAFPSLDIVLHSGSDWESLVCSASFIVKDGKVEMVEPMIKEIKGINEEKVDAVLQRYFGSVLKNNRDNIIGSKSN